MFKNIIDFKGLNRWFLMSTIGLNVVWAALMLVFTCLISQRRSERAQ